MLIDLDHFKQINDTLGHMVGDECLKLVAKALKSVDLRSTDTLARFGGEEFVVILPNTHLDNAMQIAEKTRAAIKSIDFIVDSKRPVLQASIGVASTLPAHGDDPETLLTSADRALYEAKDAGRNRISVAS